jgi:hypothetical protein
MILTRRIFRTGLECKRKLVYRRDHYPSEKKIPHEGFFALAPWARTLFPDGYQPDQDPGLCRQLIDRALTGREQVTFFSPVLTAGGCLSHPEILSAGSGRITLYHLTEKTISTLEEVDPVTASARFVKAEWRDILRDAAYDLAVAGLLFPDSPLSVRFVMPDRSRQTENDPGSSDPHDTAGAMADFLVIRELDDAVLPLVEETSRRMLRMAAILQGGETEPKRGLHCRHCEYNRTGPEHPRSGFDLCWNLPEQKEPEILWLSHVAQVDEVSGGMITRLIHNGLRHFTDIPREELGSNLDTKQGQQISGEQEGLNPGWIKATAALEYPLWFLDFEIARTALPLHRGMKPFDRLLFEWSCHKIESPGAEPVPFVWLNTEPGVPNRQFAESLKETLGETGSIITWSRFENSQIHYLADTLRDESLVKDPLAEWLAGYHRRSFDMEEWTRRFYHHPEARGRTSLKSVLAAALSRSCPKKARPLLFTRGLLKNNLQGGLVNPYDLLEGSEAVRGGTGAVSAYLDMVYGAGRQNPALKNRLKTALEEYCLLDTLAMVMLWYRWIDLSEGLLDKPALQN